MHWVTWFKPPLRFEPGSPAWEADDVPTDNDNDNENTLFDNNIQIEITIYKEFKLTKL